MKTFTTGKSLQKYLISQKRKGKSIGFVPTMGALHKGHLSLVKKSKSQNDITVVSVFVNPAQFGPNEDFHKYPRSISKDKALLQKEKADILFFPLVKEIYPYGFDTKISLPKPLTQSFCGKFRPFHFNGVALVVSKLFNISLPDRVYLGLKDFQQVAVIKQLVIDFNFPVKVVYCSTIRELDGLAFSSRNTYLSSQNRKKAPLIYSSLKQAKLEFKKGKTSAQYLKGRIRGFFTNDKDFRIEYIEIVDFSLNKVKKAHKGDAIVVAIFLGSTRLIDNIIL